MAPNRMRGGIGELAEGLLKVGALQFGTFSLPDGRDSSYYINLRSLPSYPGVYGLLTEALTGLVKKKAPKADALCAAAISGLAIASPVAISLRKPLVFARVNVKAGEKVIEGEVMPDWRVAVVDDLATSGLSIQRTAEAVEEEGGEVKDAFVLIDRREGATEKLRKKGISLHSVTDVVQLADALVSMELLNEEELKAITKSAGRQ